jgi:hypothetical protein
MFLTSWRVKKICHLLCHEDVFEIHVQENSKQVIINFLPETLEKRCFMHLKEFETMYIRTINVLLNYLF